MPVSVRLAKLVSSESLGDLSVHMGSLPGRSIYSSFHRCFLLWGRADEAAVDKEEAAKSKRRDSSFFLWIEVRFASSMPQRLKTEIP